MPTNHFLRETEYPTSRVVCPVLLQTECRFCSCLGHTVSACPALAAKKLKVKDSESARVSHYVKDSTDLHETSHSATSRQVDPLHEVRLPSHWPSHRILSLLSSSPSSTKSNTIQNPIQNPIGCYSLDQAKLTFAQESFTSVTDSKSATGDSRLRLPSPSKAGETPTVLQPAPSATSRPVEPTIAQMKESMIRAEFALVQAQAALAGVEYALAEEDDASGSTQTQAPIKWVGRSVTSWADDSSDEEEEEEEEEEEVEVEVEEGVEFAVLLYKRMESFTSVSHYV